MTSEAKKSNGKPSIPDNEIIERFGGIRPMAAKLGVAVTTVQGWKERGHIPEGRLPQIIVAAAEIGVDLGLEAPPAPESVAPKSEPKAVAEKAPGKKEKTLESKTEAKPESKDEARPAAEAPAVPPRQAGGVSWLALILAVALLGGAIVTQPLWESELYPGTGAGVVPASSHRLDEIAATHAEIEASLKDMRSELDASEKKLSGRINALEAGGGEAGTAFAEKLAVTEASMNNLAGKLDALGAGLSGIESRIAALEATQGEVPESVQAALKAADAALGDLTLSIRGVGDGLASVGANIANLESRLTVLETRPVQTGEKIAAMVLAVGQVEAGVNSGRPYRAALDRLEMLGRDDPVISGGEAVAALSPWADYGIPDRLALRRRFAELAPGINLALSGQDEGGWLDSVWNSVTGLVTVRRIDGSDLTPIGKAEQALDNGDLAAAAAAFDGRGSLGSEGDSWLNLVKARVNAEREIEALYGQMVVPLAGDSKSGAAAQ